jgi:hypothetical protein
MRRLPAQCSCRLWRRPASFARAENEHLIERLIAASNRAFGTETESVWRERFAGNYLDSLKRFYLIFDPQENVIGWTGYRCKRIRGELCVYFDTTGLVSEYQRSGVMRAVQRSAVVSELLRHPVRPIRMIVRTRSPVVYRVYLRTFGRDGVIPRPEGTVPPLEQPFISDVARWLEESPFDPTTSRVRGAYGERGRVYGTEAEPKTGDDQIDGLFERLPQEDALLLAGRARLGSIAKDLLRRSRG